MRLKIYFQAHFFVKVCKLSHRRVTDYEEILQNMRVIVQRCSRAEVRIEGEVVGAKFIHLIRKRYEVVICYLIGFNNEKKGIYDKTIFSSRIDDEWKFLNQYIKVLEKIRSFRK